MKTNKYVEDLKAKSAAELAQDLVAAKKEISWIIQQELRKLERISQEFRLLSHRKLTKLKRLLFECQRKET